MAGDGVLRDESTCALELRGFLNRVGRGDLQSYAQYCLESSFTDSGFVLQDIINEVGRRLGFDVSYGVYSGRRNNNNFDGLWVNSGWSFIVEVKTTDTYNIPLENIAKYMHTIKKDSMAGDVSCLLVVGRQDTATLEDQLRGSRYNWDMRIIGVDALFKALELRELSEDPLLSQRLIEILKPQEFTRVDQVLSMAFDFATDREESLDVALSNNDDEVDNDDASISRVAESDRQGIEQFKVIIAERLSKKFEDSLRKNRSSFEGKASGRRFSVAVSKLYPDPDRYWFAYHPRQSKYLTSVDKGYFVLGYLDSGKIFVIPVAKMDEMAAHLNTTTPNSDEAKTYYHVHTKTLEGNEVLLTRPGVPDFDISMYEI